MRNPVAYQREPLPARCKYFVGYVALDTQISVLSTHQTIEQAREAGLLRPNSNWSKRPGEMLRKTCGVQLTRIEFPRAALGLYCPEEMGIDL